MVKETLAALADGTEEALLHLPTAVGEVARASGEDEPVVAAQLRALTPALRPPITLDPAVLRKRARFDVRFGILHRRPDLRRAFALGLAPPAGWPCWSLAAASASTSAAASRAMRERGTTRSTPASSARWRTILLDVRVEGQRGQPGGRGRGQALVHIGGEVHDLDVGGLAGGHHLVPARGERAVKLRPEQQVGTDQSHARHGGDRARRSADPRTDSGRPHICVTSTRPERASRDGALL